MQKKNGLTKNYVQPGNFQSQESIRSPLPCRILPLLIWWLNIDIWTIRLDIWTLVTWSCQQNFTTIIRSIWWRLCKNLFLFITGKKNVWVSECVGNSARTLWCIAKVVPLGYDAFLSSCCKQTILSDLLGNVKTYVASSPEPCWCY